jgi:hypothetical protein
MPDLAWSCKIWHAVVLRHGTEIGVMQYSSTAHIWFARVIRLRPALQAPDSDFLLKLRCDHIW